MAQQPSQEVLSAIINVAGQWAQQRLNKETRTPELEEKTYSQQLEMFFEQSYKYLMKFMGYID